MTPMSQEEIDAEYENMTIRIDQLMKKREQVLPAARAELVEILMSYLNLQAHQKALLIDLLRHEIKIESADLARYGPDDRMWQIDPTWLESRRHRLEMLQETLAALLAS